MFKAGDLVRVKPGKGSRGRLTVGGVYEVEKVRPPYLVLVRDDEGRKPNDAVWYAERFEPVAPEVGAAIIPPTAPVPPVQPVPLTPHNAKVGMKVFAGGRTYTISKFDGGNVWLEEEHVCNRYYSFNLFTCIPDNAPVVDAPKKVKCIEGYRPAHLVLGQMYTIKADNGRLVTLEELPGKLFRKTRFDMGNAPAAEAPKPEPVDEILAELRKQQNKAGLHLTQQRRITSFAILRVGAVQAKYYINPACYAQINGEWGARQQDTGAIAVFVVDTSKHKEIYKDKLPVIKRYLNWLFNQSPWADCFTTKDVIQALDKGVVMNCNKPIGQVVGAAVALREAIEYEKYTTVFDELVRAGYHPTAAYAVSMVVGAAGKEDQYTLIGEAGHRAVALSLQQKDVISFFQKGFPDMGEKSANAPGDTKYTIDDRIGEKWGNGETYQDWASHTVNQTTTGEGWQKTKTIVRKDLFDFTNTIEKLITEKK